MALIPESVDNCGDTYAVDDVLSIGWLSGTAESIVLGRVEGGALRMSGSTIITPNELVKACALGSEFTWHGGFMAESLPGSDIVFLRFYESSTLHVDVRLTASGTIRVTRSGTSVALGTAVISAGNWYQFNIHVKVADGTAGEIHTWIDGVADIAATSLDTRNGGTGVCDRYMIRGEFGWASRFDDLHAWTGNDDRGLSRIPGRLPDSDGTYGDWTPSSGTDHSALVDDPAPDDDLTYVQSDTGAQRDSYVMTPLGVDPAATVHGVVIRAVARKIDIGARLLAMFTRTGAADFDGSDVAPTFTYSGTLIAGYEDNPDTAAAWTVAEVDGAEVGVLDNTP